MSSIQPAQLAEPLFDRIRWRDPTSGRSLQPIIGTRMPSGGVLCGALRIDGTSFGYPIVDGVARLTPALAAQYHSWLAEYGLLPPPSGQENDQFQEISTVDSFGFQWSWNSSMRSEADLVWRVADRFRVSPAEFASETILDAGCGAGDQSRWLLDQNASVVSVDLSNAIEVATRKLRHYSQWVGVQADISSLPFEEALFDRIYCEGVIQHTQDSSLSVRELCRVTKALGKIQATHYPSPRSLSSKVRHKWQEFLRRNFQSFERFPLLFTTGALAALCYVPLFGKLVKKSGTAIFSPRMPDFKTTWTNTYDNFGSHKYQRYIEAEEFRDYFEKLKDVEILFQEDTLIIAKRTSVARR